MPAKKKAEVKPKEPLYTVVLKVLGKTTTAKGDSVSEAISNLKMLGTRGNMSIMIVSRGTQKREKILNRTQTNRLFTQSRIMREVALKNVSALFDF